LEPKSAPTREAPFRSLLKQPAPSFFQTLFLLATRPQQILLLWNWKNAVLSIILRGPIFLIATVQRGWRTAMAALLTESFFCAATAGFYGAIVQTLMDAEPQWVTGIFLTVVMPVFFQVLEYLLHWFRGTPHLRGAEIVSIFVSAVSALFNWYAMRRGTLLMGAQAGSFGRDLLRLPRLLLGFVVLLPRKIAERSKTHSVGFFSAILWSDLFHGK
jgi:hypothetical protein